MASFGITRGMGGGVVPALQRAWTEGMENDLRVIEMRTEILRSAVTGVDTAVSRVLRVFAVSACVVAASSVTVAVALVVRLFHG